MSLASANEIDGVPGVPGGEHGLVRRSHPFDLHLPVFPELKRILAPVSRVLRVILPHVVRVHQAARFIESAGRRAGFGLVADVPLAKHRRPVSALLQHLSQGGEAGIQPSFARADRTHHFCPARIAAGEQRRPGSRADRLGHVEVPIRAALGGEPIDVGSPVDRSAERAKIGPSRVVKQDHDEVRRFFFGRRQESR